VLYKKTILIVDDEENIRNMLQKVLQLEGFAVLRAGTVRDRWL
jgi:DNA-binding response OmpR family regulator